MVKIKTINTTTENEAKQILETLLHEGSGIKIHTTAKQHQTRTINKTRLHRLLQDII